MIDYSNRKILGVSSWNTYKCWVINGFVFAVVMIVFFVDTFSNVSFLRLVLNGVVHSVWIVALYIIANAMFCKNEFKTLIELYRGKNKQ